MKSRIILLFIFTIIFSCSAFSQITKYNYQFAKAFPNSSYQWPLGAHGVAVDPEGKVWIQPYKGTDSILVGSTYRAITPIHVYKADGTPASFSPIRFITVAGVTDTMYSTMSNRGMNADKNGNIVIARTGGVYRLNYKTGAGMNKVIPQASTPTAPAFNDLNEMFIGPVVPGIGPIRIYDANFLSLGNVVDTSQGFSRTLGVSSDGNDVLWCGFTNYFVTKYHSANGSLGPYSQIDNVMNGLVVEAIARHPQSGYWWVGAGDPTSGSNLPPYTDYTFYAFAPPNYSTPVESFTWQGVDPFDEPRPRGIAFSPTGDTVYVCAFGVSSKPCVQMFVRGVPPVTPTITVTPSSFNVSLQTGDSTTQTLTIGNIGVASLTWSIGSATAMADIASAQLHRRTESEIASIAQSVQGQTNGTSRGTPTISPYRWQDLLASAGSKRILAWVGYTDKSTGGEFENTVNAIKQYFTDFTLDTTSTTSPTAFSSLLADKDIFLVPEQEMIGDLTSLGSSFATSLNSFVQNGKTVIVLDYAFSAGATSFLNATGLLNISNLVPSGSYTAVVHDLGSPLVVGLPSQFTAMNGSNYHTSSNGQKIVRELTSGNNMVTQRNIGAGRVIYIGMDFYNYNSDMARLLANAVQSTTSTSGFISASPQSGIVAPGLSQDVTIKVNAKSLTAGNYSGNISITNNDSVNNPKNVPVNVTVTPGPSPTITVTPTSFSLSIQQNDSTTRVMTIGNSGVADLDWNVGGSTVAGAERRVVSELRKFRLPTPSVVYSGDPDAPRSISKKLNTSKNETVGLNGGSFVSVLSAMAGTRLLFDYGHAQYGDTSSFTILLSDLRARGAMIDVSSSPFTPALLSNYDIVFIAEGSGNYTAAELTSLQNWVSSGGGLFIEGDSFSGNFGDLVIPYGIHYLGLSGTTGYTTNIVAHPITSGCDTIYLSGPVNYLSVVSPAQTVVFDRAGAPHIAVSQYGGGRVVVVSDDDFPGTSILSGDNRTMANKAADWLAGGSSFWSVSPKSGTIPPGSTQNVTVKINTTGMGIGTYNDNISINTNDPANNPKNVPLTVAVTAGPAPAITVSPASFSVTLQRSDSTTQTLTIGNTGIGVLNWQYANSSVLASENEILFSASSQWKPWSGAPPNISSKSSPGQYAQRPVRKKISVSDGAEAKAATIPFFPLFGVESSGIRQIDPTSGSIIKTFPMAFSAGPDGLAFDGKFIYALVGYNNLIFKIDASTMTVTDSITSFSTSYSIDGLATNGRLLYVLDYGTAMIHAVDLATKAIIATLNPGITIGGGITYAEKRGSLFVSNFATGIYEINATTGAVINSFASPSGATVYGVAYSNSTDILIATGSGQTYFLNPSTGSVLGSIIGGYSGLAADEASSSRFITLDPTSGTVAPGASQPVMVKFNTKELNVGIYNDAIAIANNDPFNNPKNIPASLTVTGPTLTSVVPNAATQGNTLNVSITGQNTTFRVFQGSSTIDVSHIWFSKGGSTINASSVSVSSITNLTANFTIPNSAAPGSWDINVEQPAGNGIVTLYSGFTITSILPPTITSVVPNSATRGLTLPVSITGQNSTFRVTQGSVTYDANHVWFSQGSSTINASSVSVSSATNLTANFTVPTAASTGLWNVNVEQPLSTGTVTLNNGFTINPGGGVVMSLSDAEVDFIGVRVGLTSDIIFTIRDSSVSSGTLSGSVVLSGTGFTLISGGGSFNLTPGQAWYVTVRYNAASAGFSRATLTINNNSTNYPATAVVPVRGYGVQLTANPKKILFESLHGGDFGTRTDFVNLLRTAGHTVTTTQPTFNLSGYDYLLLASQTSFFTTSEISQIQSFVNAGGNVLILADWGGLFGALQQNALLSAPGWTTGIKVDSLIVRDPSQIINGVDSWIKVSTFPDRSDQLLIGVDTLGVFAATSLHVTLPAQVIATTTSGGMTLAPTVAAPRTPLHIADVETFATRVFNQKNITELSKSNVVSDEQSDKVPITDAPLTLVSLVAKTSIGKGQIIVTGDMSIFGNSFTAPNYFPGLRYAANRIFALNIFQSGGSLIPTPKILSVRDVPNDNGKQVFVRWKVDQPAVSSGIARFGVWRKDSVWTFLKDSVLTVNDTVFQFVAPTIYDSTKVSGMRYSVFRVSAHNVNPAIFTTSQPDSGYSLDNLAPSVPKGVRGTVQGGGTIAALLQWNKVPEKDLRYFAIYRSETPGFSQYDSLTFIGASADTTYRDTTVVYGRKYYYRIVAFDWSGNRSDPSDQLALTVTSVGRIGFELPKEYSLAQNYPNPFNPSTIIRYGVPARSRVKTEVYNTIGQRIATLVDDEREAGYYEVEWRAAVASGIYMYRIEAVAVDNPNNVFIQVKKMVLVR